jgi:peptide/nickel transport system substrate-binding protein
VNARVFQGNAKPETALLAPGFLWDPQVPGPKYDPELAKQLVAKAKSAGFNGTIRLLAGNDPVGTNFGVTVKSMLDVVGFNTVITSVPPGANVAPVLIQHDYDLAQWAFNLPPDDGVFGQLFISFDSQSNRYGYSSPDMDSGIDHLRIASTDAEKVAALKTISTAFTRDVPAMVMSPQTQDIFTTSSVHGIEPSSAGEVIFNQAWISK